MSQNAKAILRDGRLGFVLFQKQMVFPCGLLHALPMQTKENSVIVFAIRKYSSLFPSADKRSSLSYQVATVAIEMVYLCVFFLFSFLGIYLWLFSSNRCSRQTSVRIRQLWKYLWAEKCEAGSNTKQWPGPHPPEVSRPLHDGGREVQEGLLSFYLKKLWNSSSTSHKGVLLLLS